MCSTHQPHVIVIAATDMRAVNLKRDIEKTVRNAVDTRKLLRDIPIEFVTSEAALVYSKSKTAEVKSFNLNRYLIS